MNQPQICKLCLQPTPLVESHIIPETLWEKVYDKLHRTMPMSTEGINERIIQKGLKQRLLCETCDRSKLSPWENVLKKSLVELGNKGGANISVKEMPENHLFAEGIRYREFKLAILSILWRMSITNIPFFNSYYLGPYDEIFRNFIYSGSVPTEDQYPVMIERYELEGEILPGLIMGAPRGKFDRMITIWSFMIWSHQFTVFVTRGGLPKEVMPAFLRDSGAALIRKRSFEELAKPDSVLAKIFDPKLQKFFDGKK